MGFISPIFRDVFVFTVKRLYVGEWGPKGKSVLKLMAAAFCGFYEELYVYAEECGLSEA